MWSGAMALSWALLDVDLAGKGGGTLNFVGQRKKV